MKKMGYQKGKRFESLKAIMQSEEGQGMVEYGLIIGLVSIALIAALVIFAPQIAGVFTRAGTAMDGVAA